MDEQLFWSMIEDSWPRTPESHFLRELAFAGQLEDTQALYTLQKAFMQNLITVLDQLPAPDVLTFDRILERKLYDIDRADIHEYTDGSDDGFLYCRGFIVSMGQAYYTAVQADPSRARVDLELEDVCYVAVHLYEDKFGVFPPSDISRETGSNQEGWTEG